MKRFFKVFLGLIALLFITVVIFYFWAKSPVFSDKDYNVYTEYPDAVYIQPKQDTISVMSYNVGYLSGMTNNKPLKPTRDFYKKNEVDFLAKLKSANVDIIGTQEIDYKSQRSYELNQNEYVAKELYPYTVTAVNWDKHYVPFPFESYKLHFGRILSGQSILSKFPLKNPERIALERVESLPFYYQAIYLDRLLQIVHVEHPAKNFIFMNLHAEAFDLPTRQKQLKFVYDKFKELSKNNAVILVGDFNSDFKAKESAFYQFINDESIGKASVSDIENTPNSFPSNNPNVRLDYIFFTNKDFELINSKILVDFGEISDHLPCYAELKMK